MPRVLRGEALANAIYQATDKLEEQFAEIFIAEVRKLSRSKALQALLDEIETGQLASSGISARLNLISIPTKKLDELIRKAMGSAIRITNEKTGLKLAFDYRNPDVIQAARGMSIDLSTNLTNTAQQILQKAIGDAIEGLITRREAIKIIESRVGLIPAHSDAVDRYYEKLIAEGRKKADAKRLAEEYADRLLRYRATTIARTEIARATGIGQTEFWKQAIADGLLPPKTKRVWITAADERVCEICGAMDGVQVEIGQPWMTNNGLVQYPSAAHPNCRCTQGIALSKDYLKMFRSEIAERQETIDELQKIDSLKLDWWSLSKFNPYHDNLGRFTTSSGGVSSGSGTRLGPEGVEMQVAEPIAELATHLGGKDYSGVYAVPSGKRQRVAEAYDAMPMLDDKAKPAYDEMAREVDKQFAILKRMGIKVEFVDYDPYRSFQEMRNDFVKNRRLRVMKTSVTGSHPYWSNDTNDKFRAVHDVFGHLATGRGFDRHGEEAAYQAHKSMMPPSVHRALATETRGQNAYYIENGDFPPQKVGLLPEELAKKYEKSVFKVASITADDDNLYEIGQSHHVTGGRYFRISKANPYHDELGRFTSASRASAPKRNKPNVRRKNKKTGTVKVEPFSPRRIPKSELTRHIKEFGKYPYDPQEVEGELWEHQDQLDSLGDSEPYPSGHTMTKHQKDAIDIVSYSWINDFQRSQYIRATASRLITDNEVDYYASEERLGKTKKDIEWSRLGMQDDTEITVATAIQAIREAPKSVVWRGLRLTPEAASKLVVGAIHEEGLATGTGRRGLAEQFTFGRWMNPEMARDKPIRVLLKIKCRNIPIGESPVNSPKQVKSFVQNFLLGTGDSVPLVAYADERFISGKYRVISKPTMDRSGMLVVEMEEVG